MGAFDKTRVIGMLATDKHNFEGTVQFHEEFFEAHKGSHILTDAITDWIRILDQRREQETRHYYDED